MSKKKPIKKPTKTDDALREACEDIVANLYVEVEKFSGIRMDALSGRMDDLAARIDDVYAQLDAVGPVRRFFRRFFGGR